MPLWGLLVYTRHVHMHMHMRMRMCACAGRQQARAARQQGCEWLGNPECVSPLRA